MLLLESLQNTLLRWKLLELLLDYSCPLKTTVPMSLNLLLHFMKNCILAPDSMVNTKESFFFIYIIFTLLLYTANKNCMNKDVLTLVKCKVLYLTVNRRMVQKGGRSGKSWSVISGCCCSATRQREVRSFYHCSPCKCCITQEQSPSFYSNSTNSKLAA